MIRGVHYTPQQIKNTKRFLWVVSTSPLLAGITYVSYVKYRTSKEQHRAFNITDQHFLRYMNGNTPKITDNPGIRIEPKFLSYEEQEDLRLDSRVLINAYGYSTIPYYIKPRFDKHISLYKSNVKVNAYKATGRKPPKYLDEQIKEKSFQVSNPEEEEHTKKLFSSSDNESFVSNPVQIAPWLNGHKFDIEKLPKSYKELINKIKNLRGYKLGDVRDVTIDYRNSYYFRVDPHIYPNTDGNTVFMITLESDCIVTLLPDENEVYRRSTMKDIVNNSYTDDDIDILHRRGDLLSLSGKARHELHWCQRQGIDVKKTILTKTIHDRFFKLKNKKINQFDDNVLEDKQKEIDNQIEETDNFDNITINVLGNFESVDLSDEKYILCDWWGNQNYILPRNKEKYTITVTFARNT